MNSSDKGPFHITKRVESFVHAWRGLKLFFKTTPNATLQVLATIFVIFLGFYLYISAVEWIAVILSIGLVFVAECINTAIEIDINLTSPEYHPFARDTKDVAAAAVLLASFVAVGVGVLIFLPKILLYVKM